MAQGYIIREMREERGRLGGFDDSRLRERVEVLGPEVFLDVLRSAVSTVLIDRLGATWDERYGELERYKEEHGHCRVPDEHVTADGFQLGAWVGTQRVTRDRMPAERRKRLDALGFVWDVSDYQWEEGFAHLQAFVCEHGHCTVPALYTSAKGFRLGNWVRVQRRSRDSMPADRKARLDALGFVWDPLTDQWEEGFQHLQAYAKEHGHCRVRSDHVMADEYRLGKWVTVQRTRGDRMPADRKARLDALGFNWKVKDQQRPVPGSAGNASSKSTTTSSRR
jgi:hypothetical protein